jgi:hypothetical protein
MADQRMPFVSTPDRIPHICWRVKSIAASFDLLCLTLRKYTSSDRCDQEQYLLPHVA